MLLDATSSGVADGAGVAWSALEFGFWNLEAFGSFQSAMNFL